jgi:hypothetical protein
MNRRVYLNSETKALITDYYVQKRYSDIVANLQKMLKAIFNTWGFDNYQFFKTIVLRFYPEVNERHLYQFYTGTVVREDVLKYVHYTYQILNV